jgi:holo-[acyl-carrier protein] synthase
VIVGLGIDVVALPRVERMWRRWGERIAARVLGEDERRAMVTSEPRVIEWLAGRIAAKEAASKALGVPTGIHWHHAEVLAARPGPPTLRWHGVARARADALGVTGVHLSITHDAGFAAAVVVLER